MAFYLDASVPVAVAKALELVRDDVLYAGAEGCPIQSADDVNWLPLAGANDWVVVVRDKRIRYRPGERDALLQAGVRSFCFTGGGNYSRWQMLELFVRQFEAIEAAALNPGPFIDAVTQAGVRRIVPVETAP